MRTRIRRFVSSAAVAALLASVPGCGVPLRVCTNCSYKSRTTFGSAAKPLPTGTITSATVEVKVKHAGTCPQPSFPNDCTEVLTYDVKCKIGTATSIIVPFLVDALPPNTSHSAKLTVVTPAGTSTFTGTVDQNSNVPGGGAPPSSIPTPCPPPAVDPYQTLPRVQ